MTQEKGHGPMTQNLKCNHCEAEHADRYALVGSVVADLCPRCRTNLHTFVSSETRVTEYWEKHVERGAAMRDPLIFKSVNADFLDLEMEIHKVVKEWVYGPDDSAA